jgi:uroporphyrin-3 C-methyltransferase
LSDEKDRDTTGAGDGLEHADDARGPGEGGEGGEGGDSGEATAIQREGSDVDAAAASPKAGAAPPPGSAERAAPAQAAVAVPVAPAPRSTAAPIAWLALLLVLVVAAGTFYLMMDVQRREGQILERVKGLESVSGREDTGFDQMRSNLERQIELEVEGIKASQQRAEQDLKRALDGQERELKRLESLASDASSGVRRVVDEQLAALERSLREQQQRINDLTVEDRETWQLAEVQYLLRLANQRMIMTGDTVSAAALLRSADNILRELDDPGLHGLRSAVAADLAAVRAVPKLDIQGLYLRLDALIRQTDALVLFELPQRKVEAMEPDSDDWKTRLSQGYQTALAKLSEYVVVSRRDIPVETLMDPQYEGLVRQNMRMLLEQAQVAMLSGNELLFRQSLERAEGWVSQFFKADQQAAIAMAQELRQIRDERVSVTLPDLSASLQALDTAMQARLARGGN